MVITDQARDFLNKMFQEQQNAKSIRIFFAGFGWGTPKIGLALDEPEAEDIIETINDITVAIDPTIKSNTVDLTVDISGDKKGLALLGDTGNCC